MSGASHITALALFKEDMFWECLAKLKIYILCLISFPKNHCISFIRTGSVLGYKYDTSKSNIVPLSLVCFNSLSMFSRALYSFSIFWEGWIPQLVGQFWYSSSWRFIQLNVNTTRNANAVAAPGSSLMWLTATSMLPWNSSPHSTRWISPCIIIKEMKLSKNTMNVWWGKD